MHGASYAAGAAYSSAVREKADLLARVTAQLSMPSAPPTTLLVLSDHGHLARGGAGGVSAEERDAPLLTYRLGSSVAAAASAESAAACTSGSHSMVDVSPTISALLGAPVPRHSQGRCAAHQRPSPPLPSLASPPSSPTPTPTPTRQVHCGALRPRRLLSQPRDANLASAAVVGRRRLGPRARCVAVARHLLAAPRACLLLPPQPGREQALGARLPRLLPSHTGPARRGRRGLRRRLPPARCRAAQPLRERAARQRGLGGVAEPAGRRLPPGARARARALRDADADLLRPSDRPRPLPGLVRLEGREGLRLRAVRRRAVLRARAAHLRRLPDGEWLPLVLLRRLAARERAQLPRLRRAARRARRVPHAARRAPAARRLAEPRERHLPARVGDVRARRRDPGLPRDRDALPLSLLRRARGAARRLRHRRPLLALLLHHPPHLLQQVHRRRRVGVPLRRHDRPGASPPRGAATERRRPPSPTRPPPARPLPPAATPPCR